MHQRPSGGSYNIRQKFLLINLWVTVNRNTISKCVNVIFGPHSERNYSFVISYFNTLLNFSQNAIENVLIHTKYRLFAMKGIMINLLQTNIQRRRRWRRYNDMENYDSKDCIICERMNSGSYVLWLSVGLLLIFLVGK